MIGINKLDLGLVKKQARLNTLNPDCPLGTQQSKNSIAKKNAAKLIIPRIRSGGFLSYITDGGTWHAHLRGRSGKKRPQKGPEIAFTLEAISPFPQNGRTFTGFPPGFCCLQWKPWVVSNPAINDHQNCFLPSHCHILGPAGGQILITVLPDGKLQHRFD